jgi:predicted tellurium resistance membrane protein TerC
VSVSQPPFFYWKNHSNKNRIILRFVLLFDVFKVPVALQPTALKASLFGAITMRAIMISVGVDLTQCFRSIVLIFAGVLVFSSWNLFTTGGGKHVKKVLKRDCLFMDYFHAFILMFLASFQTGCVQPWTTLMGPISSPM